MTVRTRGDVVERLAEVLPADALVTDPDVVAAHARDHAALCHAGTAVALVRARTADAVAATLRVADSTGTPVVTRGAGTGLAGGANAVEGGIILSVAGMDRIVDLDPVARTAVVEPGVLNGDLDRAAGAHGLMYAPDPASRDISTIGGNVATNAGGACCLQYGVTGDHVAALTAVLADGTTVRTGGVTVKDVAGLDLTRLLVGSEGTLAVIVEVTVRLVPRRPVVGTVAAFFDDLADAGKAIVALRDAGGLSRLEVMDRPTMTAVEAMTHMDLDPSAAAMVLAQADGGGTAVVDAAAAACEAHGASFVATTDDEAEGRQFMAARSAALPALEAQGRCLLDDVAVPIARIPDLLDLCRTAAAETGVLVAVFGHAGDGNLHPTIVYDPADRAAADAAATAFDLVLEGALALGGTVTGEHGVGTLKQPWVRRQVGDREVALMQGIKRVFDPQGILNPGKGF